MTANNVRERIVRLGEKVNAHHMGSSLSVVEILYSLYSYRQKNPSCRILLSKGHAAIAFYSVLCEFGEISEAEIIDGYQQFGSSFLGHVSSQHWKQIDWSAGALGHCAGVAVGMALAEKNKHVFVVLSDGELGNGSNWEAFFLASKLRLSNLFFLVDFNGLQGIDFENKVLDLNRKIIKMMQELEYSVIEVNGHDEIAINNILYDESKTHGPKFILCRTVKAKGLPSFEGKVESHYQSGRKELTQDYERSILSGAHKKS